MSDSDPLWGSLLLQVVLILINAFFASTEIAVLSLNENKVRRDAEEGDVKARRMLGMVREPSAFLSTIQVGITLAGFLSSAFAADSFSEPLAEWLHGTVGLTLMPLATLRTACLVLITVILSFFMLIFGELVPKRIATQKSEKVARFSSGFIAVLAKLMKPVVWLLSAVTNGVLRLIGIDPNREEEHVTEEEIRMMVDIGEEKGSIESGEAELIDNVFEFNNLTAADVMIHRTDVSALHVADSDAEVMQTILETGFSRFPVYDEDVDDIVGILSTRDFLINSRAENPKPLRELLRPAYLVPETVRADALLKDMQKKKRHMAIVVDEYGGTSGLLTMEDLLEEIVGDIFDEYDPTEEVDIMRLEENLWRVNGSAKLDTLSDELDIALPLDEEFDTLGGLVYSCLTVIPEDGSTPVITASGLRVQVEKIEDRRIESALVSKLSGEDGASGASEEQHAAASSSAAG